MVCVLHTVVLSHLTDLKLGDGSSPDKHKTPHLTDIELGDWGTPQVVELQIDGHFEVLASIR